MKTLKKTLCLVLAVVMAVGVLVLPANAATEFTDDADITHDEAVAVLSGLDIVNGKGDGTFDPNGNFTREQAAALVAQVVLTPEGAKLLTDSKAVFSDVPVTNGYNKYITWAVEEGYISGYPDGTFKPKNELTGLQLAALMVEVLGEELDGSNYQNFVALKTKEYGLSEGITGYSASKVISRDDAVQMMFNAMKRSPEGEKAWYIVNNKGDKYGPFDSSLEAALMANALPDYKPQQLDNGEGSILDETYKTTFSASTPDAFGRPTSTWKQTVGNDTVTLYQKANTPVAGPYYTAKTLKDIFVTDLKLDITGTKSVQAKLFIDGVRSNMATAQQNTPYSGTGAANNIVERDVGTNAANYVMGDRGYETTVYKNGDVYEIYVVTTTAVEVTSTNLKDGVLTLSGTGDDALTYEDASLKTGDYVIYQASATEVYKAQKAEVISGRITGKSSKNSDPYFLIEGAKTYLSAASDLEFSDTDIPVGASKTYNFVLDFQNNVIDKSEVSGETPAANYAYVIDYQTGGGTLLTGTAVARADVFDFVTNTRRVVEIAIARGTDGNYYLANTSGSATSTSIANAFNARDFVSYTETSDNTWVMTKKDVVSNVTITEGLASITAGGTKYATTKTVMYYLNTTNNTGSTYVGYKNFAGTTGATAFIEYSDAAETTVKTIYVMNAGSASVTGPTIPASRAIYMGKGEVTLDGTEYNFYVNGELKTFVFNATDLGNLTGNALLIDDNVEKAFNVQISGDELSSVAQISTAQNNKTGATIKAVGDGFLVLDDNSVLYIADDMLVYDATADKFISAVSIPDDKDTITADLYAVTDSGTSASDKLINLVIISAYNVTE